MSLKRVIACLKVITVVACVLGFLSNSKESFIKFVRNSKLDLSSTQLHDKLPMPTIVLCNASGYNQRINKWDALSTIKKYEAKTMDPMKLKMDGSFKGMNSTRRVLNTKFLGRCLVVETKLKVSV